MVDAAMKNGVRANLPNYPGVDYAKLVRFASLFYNAIAFIFCDRFLDESRSWRMERNAQISKWMPYMHETFFWQYERQMFLYVFFKNLFTLILGVEAKEAEIPDDDIDRMLIMLLKKSLNPDPTSRFSATTLLLYISDFERYRLSEEPLVDKNHE